MCTFRRRPGTDTWHLSRSCSGWPMTIGFEERSSLPAFGKLCGSCLASGAPSPVVKVTIKR